VKQGSFYTVFSRFDDSFGLEGFFWNFLTFNGPIRKEQRTILRHAYIAVFPQRGKIF